jgi:glutaredoxin 3
MSDIEIYTQPWCPYCRQALRLLQSKGVEFREIDAPQGTEARAESIRRAGGRTSVPQIFIRGTHVGGCDDLMAWEADGRLDRILASS